jgi:hypothetical protein
MDANTVTREEWLTTVLETELYSILDSVEIPRPDRPVQVSTGLPSVRALARKRRSIGECWPSSQGSDVYHIFISPTIDDGVVAVATLLHEVLHASDGCKHGHRAPFSAWIRRVGLDGKPTATKAGSDLEAAIKTWISVLGEYPHRKLNPKDRPTKKQSTRLVKVTCPACGCVCRITRKWLDAIGAPYCACPGHPQMEEA